MGWKHLTTILSIAVLNFIFIIQAIAGAPWNKFSYFSNSGGLNDNASTLEIEDNEATDIQNVIFDTGGAIKKRFGYQNIPNNPITKVVSGATGITGLIFFGKASDSTRYLVGIANVNGKATAFKKTYNTGGGSLPDGPWDSIDYSGLPSSYTNDQLVSMSIAQDSVVMTMPATTAVKPFRWTGTGNVVDLTANVNVPTCSLNAFHKNILFVSGNTTNPSRLYFSNLGDITVWTSTDFFDVGTNDGTKIRGIFSAFDSLYIFKDRSIWRLSGSDRDSFILEKMVDNVGTLSQQSISVLGNLIYFVTEQNDIAVYDGTYSISFLSQKIRNTIGSLNFSRSSNALGIGFSTYKYVDYDFYTSVSLSGSGTNNEILLFDTAHKAWTKLIGINVNAWTIADSTTGTGQRTLVFGDYNGYVYFYPSAAYHDGDVTSDPIKAFYQTKWFRYSDNSLGDKYWRIIKTYTLSESTSSILNFDCRSDYESTGKIFTMDLGQSGALWNVAKWDVDKWSGQSLITQRNEVNKGKNIFQIKFYNNDIERGFTILGWENYIEPTDRY